MFPPGHRLKGSSTTFLKFLVEDELLALRAHLPTYFTCISLADRVADTDALFTTGTAPPPA